MKSFRIQAAALASFLVLTCFNALAQVPLPAFPGAEGFGAGASGGRGGRVIHVTNLNAAGPGSLQDALDQTGGRTIVFEVSGVINAPVRLTHGDVTVAGQTSPGGVTVRGFVVEGDVVCEDDSDACVPNLAPQNFVIRFIRSRDPSSEVDPSAISGGDAFRLHRAKNGIIDRVSAGNAYDEAFQISFSSDITIQNSLLAETQGEHADLGGMLINYSDPARNYPLTRLSLHHNVWHRINGRLPELSRENYPSASGSSMDIELSSNLFHDPSFPMWISLSCAPNADNPLLCPIDYRLNMAGNLFHTRAPRFNHGMLTLESGLSPSLGYLPTDTATRFFLSGNRVTQFSTVSDYQLVYCCNNYSEALADHSIPYPDTSRPPHFSLSTRNDFPAISITAADKLFDYAVREVGVFPRDPMDERLMAFLQNRSFSTAPSNVNPAGDALAVVANPGQVQVDTDRDGIPDAWENTHGLDPLGASNNGFELSTNPSNGIPGCTAGYSNLECYLNALAEERRGGRKPRAFLVPLGLLLD